MILVASCSRTKDSAMNRGFHSMNTKYNTLYNGSVAFDQGLRELNSKYVDDYWERLPIEPLKIAELAMPGAKRGETSWSACQAIPRSADIGPSHAACGKHPPTRPSFRRNGAEFACGPTRKKSSRILARVAGIRWMFSANWWSSRPESSGWLAAACSTAGGRSANVIC